jgi:hypothetical protein
MFLSDEVASSFDGGDIRSCGFVVGGEVLNWVFEPLLKEDVLAYVGPGQVYSAYVYASREIRSGAEILNLLSAE